MEKRKAITLSIMVLLLAGSVAAIAPLMFSDIEVSNNAEIRGENNNHVSYSYGIRNNGQTDRTVHAEYGYSKYDHEREKWVEVESAKINEVFRAGQGGGFGAFVTLEPGYYMFWIKTKDLDKIRENNEAREFITIR